MILHLPEDLSSTGTGCPSPLLGCKILPSTSCTQPSLTLSTWCSPQRPHVTAAKGKADLHLAHHHPLPPQELLRQPGDTAGWWVHHQVLRCAGRLAPRCRHRHPGWRVLRQLEDPSMSVAALLPPQLRAAGGYPPLPCSTRCSCSWLHSPYSGIFYSSS